MKNLIYTQIHPLPDESASVISFLFFFEHDLDFFIKVYFLELDEARH